MTLSIPSAASVTEKLPRLLRRHRLMKAWMALTGEPALQLVRIRDNHFAYADMNEGFLRLIVIDQAFETDFFEIADRLLGNGGTFFDVGANYGLLSFGLAGRHGASIDFHLFEPNPSLASAIQRSRQAYPSMRMSLNEVAVGEREGVVAFEINPEHTGASHISEAVTGVEVPCVTLDDYIAGSAVSTIDLLKIDIEGFELPALRGGRTSLERRAIRAVYFEYCEKWLRRVGEPGDLLRFIEAVGFVPCLCRSADLTAAGGATRAVDGVPLRPLDGRQPPASTDLIAVPKERIASL